MSGNKLIIIVCCLLMLNCTPPDRHGNNPIDENEYYVDDTNNVKDTTESTKVFDAPYIKMYVENSGSIDGYVKGGSDLRDLVQGYLYNVDMSELTPRGLSCYFINDRIIPMGSDIEEYVKKITPTYFKKNGGNRGTSDLAEIFKKIMPKGDTVALLVSDCIFSPGKEDASHYVTGQYNQIKHHFYQATKGGASSVLIYRFEGDFNGTYYDCKDNPSSFNGKRPFYLIAIGKDEYLRSLRSIEDKLPIKISNKCIITHGTSTVEYAILPSSDYRVNRRNNHAIENATLAKGKGSQRTNGKKLYITIGVDLTEIIANERYISDVSNWQTNNAAYSVVSVDNSSNARYTHIIKLESTSNSKTDVDIILKNQMPKWLFRFNSDDCGAPSQSDSVQTTYGLKKMAQGIFDAYTDKDDNLCKLTISINQ